MPSTKPTQFPSEYRDIVQRLADPATEVRRRSIPCGSDAEARRMQWHIYRYLTVCDRAGADEGGPSRDELRAFRQCYALTSEGPDLVFLPRSDSPRAKAANAFLMSLMDETPQASPTQPDASQAPTTLPDIPSLFGPTGRYLLPEAQAKSDPLSPPSETPKPTKGN